MITPGMRRKIMITIISRFTNMMTMTTMMFIIEKEKLTEILREMKEKIEMREILLETLIIGIFPIEMYQILINKIIKTM